ncbi:MAG: type II toxin-antitoxin system PemK/MazF family toxin [Pseudolysinimonas sp.]
MSDPIRRGGIYLVPDTSVNFPPRTLKDRNIKRRRPFLVLSNDATNTDESWLIVLGFPLSTSKDFRSEFDIELSAAIEGLTEDCWVQVAMLQPLAKAKLVTRLGQVPASEMERVVTNLARYSGLID